MTSVDIFLMACLHIRMDQKLKINEVKTSLQIEQVGFDNNTLHN